MMRILLGAGLVIALLAGVGIADTVAFERRAAALEKDWRAAEAAGLARDRLAPARAALADVRGRRAGPLPYAVVSGAIVVDPFAHAQGLATSAVRGRAEKALARLHELGGPGYEPTYRQHADALRRASRTSELLSLGSRWEREAVELGEVRDRLARLSGGLDDRGLPRDVVVALARLQSVANDAQQSHLRTEPAAQALEHGQAYLGRTYPELLARHGDVLGELRSAVEAVQRRIDTAARAEELSGQLPDLLALAARYGAGGYQARADTAKAGIRAAAEAQDDARMEQATGELQALVEEMKGAVAAARRRQQEAALAAARAGVDACLDGAPSKLIVIRLGVQQLVAYDNGCPFVRTPITSGRPELPTPTGTYAIQAKFPSYQMVSPWPKDSPYYYETATVHWAMRFRGDGYFLHSAEWQPASTYGPGSDRGPYASHGCVHVQNSPLQRLFDWAPVGTTVIVTG